MNAIKKLLIVLIFFIPSIFQSCTDKNHSEIDNPDETAKEVAIELIQEKENLQYIESVYEEDNMEFLKGEYVQSIPQQIRRKKVTASEGCDTIMNADEVPVFTSENINEKIYVDGTYLYESVNTTPADSNYFDSLNVETTPVKEKTAKTVIKDGTVYLFNSSNEVIQTEKTDEINYSSLLDSIRSAMAFEQQNEGSSSMQKAKAMPLKRLTKAIQSAQTAGMKLVSQNDDEVVMEMNLCSSTCSSLAKKVESSVQRRAVMKFSGDMTRMKEQKVYENNQLVQSVTYEFQDDNDMFIKKAPSVLKDLLPNSSVKGITYKTLMYRNNETPFIVVNKESYKKNQVNYNLYK